MKEYRNIIIVGENMNSIQIIIDNKISNIDIYIDVLKETIIVNNQEQKINEEQIDDLQKVKMIL